jgi:hypothetical protein
MLTCVTGEPRRVYRHRDFEAMAVVRSLAGPLL